MNQTRNPSVAIRGLAAGAVLAGAALLGACRGDAPADGKIDHAKAAPLERVALEHNLNPEEARVALETFIPPGRYDEFTMITSGGHSGSIYVIGVPSMRMIKEIPVFAPNSWQGWAQGALESHKVLDEGSFGPGLPVQTWGDLHHPQISLTNGDYDGEWIFAADKSAGRIAVIDLRDFRTKQIVKTPNVISDHSHFVTTNTEYAVSTTFQGSPGGPGEYAPLDEYKDKYRGMMTFHKFDRAAGRIRLDESFQIQLPPYWQDLSIGGKGPSEGLAFVNSMNVELSVGSYREGQPPMEIGASMNEMDFLQVVDWKKAEQMVRNGDPRIVEKNGIKQIPLELARDEGLLYLVPESKSPHGCDLSPGGEYVIVSGKLDPHITAYSVEKIRQAIGAKTFEGRDIYGIPILKYDAVREAYVEVGLGPLHTVFDDKGHGYTSLFLDSAVAKFTLGPPYHEGEAAWKLVDKVNIHYNIGHLQTPASNTNRPRGRYLVALNKWVVDRHPGTGPLHPQNLQLIDISGAKMRLLNEVPIIGEPHNSQIIETDRVAAWRTYPPGTDPQTMAPAPHATKQGEERVEQTPEGVHAHMVVIRSHYKPDVIRVKQGQKVILDITNAESAEDATHGFGLHGYNITASIDPGATERVEFVADVPGVYPFYCTEFCSALHMEMTGWVIVEPRGSGVGQPSRAKHSQAAARAPRQGEAAR
ncbi:MAG TPA: Sec-dependent nitrous-oxide reductase [Thermoanaerobaculia bacterium]|nr:Sec-dependent nitrous-oxide reductase [Thermoanaerobaculia bacterium]